MKTIKSNPILVALGVAFIIGAILVAVFIFYPSTQPGTIPTTLYVASTSLPAGSTVSVSELSTQTLDLPPGFGNGYVSPANIKQLGAYELLVPVSPGVLIPTSDFAPAVSSRDSGVAISFKSSPSLAVGDVVDVLINVQGPGGGTTVTTLLRNIRLQGVAGSGWLISVPTSIASAVVYASSNSALTATLVVAGNQSAPPPAVNSLAEALAIIQRSGAA